MQHKQFRAPHAAHLMLAAAWAGAVLGCASDHQLGDLSPGGFGIEEGDSQTGGGDTLVSAELGGPDFSFQAESDGFHSLAVGVGDLDGDGFGDLATLERGYVRIRYGGPRPEGLSAAIWAEGGARLLLGSEGPIGIESITPTGDFDADGYADFIVRLAHCVGTNEEAYLVYGGPDRLEGAAALRDAAVFLKGPFHEGKPGACAFGSGGLTAALGDFDGDGFDDFMLSNLPSSYLGNATSDPGGAYLFYGRAERIEAGTSWASADARIEPPQSLGFVPTGDVNADGFGDLILGGYGVDLVSEPPRFYWLPGRATRLSGTIDLAAAAMSIAIMGAQSVGDLDGDGVNDVLLYEGDGITLPETAHLFYGAAGLFDDGVDLTQAAARFALFPDESQLTLTRAHDLDGDGDDELVSSRSVGWGIGGSVPHLVALHSGSTSRLAGDVSFPPVTNPPPEEGSSFVEAVFPIGDLDGDGAADLVTRSHWYPSADESGLRNFASPLEYRVLEAQLNIHYGTPGGEIAAPPR